MGGVDTLYLCRISPESSELRHTVGVSVRVKVDVSQALSGIHEVEKVHIPFALAATLTKVAKGAQGKVQEGLAGKFVLRNDFTKAGIRIKPAKKGGDTKFEADVHTDTANRKTGAPDYMGKQEDGGERVPFGGHMHMAIPTKYLRAMVGETSVIPAEMRPKALLTAVNGNYTGRTRKGQIAIRSQVRVRGMIFFLQTSRSGTPMIMGRYWTDRDAYPFYILARNVRTKPRLDMDKAVEAYAMANFDSAWAEQWRAMRVKGLRVSL